MYKNPHQCSITLVNYNALNLFNGLIDSSLGEIFTRFWAIRLIPIHACEEAVFVHTVVSVFLYKNLPSFESE